MTNDLQNFYLYLKTKEASIKTTKGYFKEGSKNYIWNDKWEQHYKDCAYTLLDYCSRYEEIYKTLEGLNLITPQSNHKQ